MDDCEIDTVFFSKAVAMLPRPGQQYVAQSGTVYLRNGKHEKVEVVHIGGSAYLRRSLVKDPDTYMTIALSSPTIEGILWRRKAEAEPKKGRR